MKYSIIIPAYNEEGRLPECLNTLKRVFASEDSEIIVIDDGSTDRTADIAGKYGVRVVSFKENRGKGAALRRGFKEARGEVILTTDADLPASPEEMVKLGTLVREGYDIAIGSRRIKGAKINRSAGKRFMGWAFNMLVRLMTGLSYKDTQCGVKALKNAAAKKVIEYLSEEGFAVDVDVLLAAKTLGFKVKEEGIKWSDRPGSKVRLLRDSLQMFQALIRLRKKYMALERAIVREGFSCMAGR
ncbi:glycosyltransferase [Moorella naiadis]|uniref:glycosyltransferase n=1 Tax=Moorella naiadis (nom. illeg.) TaxID=3093670 RepID=UPI003D9C8893